MSMSAESVIGQDSHQGSLVSNSKDNDEEEEQKIDCDNCGEVAGVLNGVLNGMGALSVSECVQLSQEEIEALKTEELRDLVIRMQILMVADTDNKTQLNATLLDLRQTVEEMTNYLKEDKLTTKSAQNEIIQWKELTIQLRNSVIQVKNNIIKVKDHVIKVQDQVIVELGKIRAELVRTFNQAIHVNDNLIALQESEIKELRQEVMTLYTEKWQKLGQVSHYSPKIGTIDIGSTRKSRFTRFAQNVSRKFKSIFL